VKDRNYAQAQAQIDERITTLNGFLLQASDAMRQRRPGEALRLLMSARDALEGAITSARWAATLPDPNEEDKQQ
jgi:hypothetical protein